MLRYWLAASLATMIATEAAAQQIIWNPNSPRAQRELRVNPPPRPLPGQLSETIEPERWGTMSGQMRGPTWGTIGTYGWYGNTPPPAGGLSGVR